MCLVLPLCGVFAILKNKKKFGFFPIANPVLSLYICTLFYFNIGKNKKERQGNKKKIIIWFWGKWFTWDSNSRPLILQASALTTALRKIYNWACICPIYRQPIFIINLNTDKTVSMQSELLAFLPTLKTHKEFQLVSRPQLSERVSSLTSRSLSVKPFVQCIVYVNVFLLALNIIFGIRIHLLL